MTRGEWTAAGIVAGILGILAYFGGGETKVKSMLHGEENETALGAMVDAVSDRVGLARGILRAIVAQESGWIPDAVNRITGDYGLTQLNLKTAKALRPDLSDQMPGILLDAGVNLSIAEDLLREILRAGVRDAEGIFHSWNVGWPSYKKGKRSPYIARYLARLAEYETGVA